MKTQAAAVLLLAAFSLSAQDRDKIRNALECAKKIDAALKGKKDAAMPATDAEFLRRVTLDLAGTIPTVGETRAFLAEGSPTKREEWIEKLLASETHADLWARIWCTILFGNYHDLRVNVGGKNLEGGVIRKALGEFRKWLRDQIAKDVPWPAIVADLIQATGKLTENPVVLYKVSFYGEGEASLNLADGISKSFLGMRISCARCHDHPFDRWTQEDYYGLAAFLVRMKVKPAPSKGGMGKNYDTDDVEFAEEGNGEMTMPETSKMMKPKFLFGGQAGTTDARLPLLARFLVAKGNTQLPRNVVNRLWAWLMGRGFVEPVDDFNAQNKPLLAKLLDDLSKDFVGSGYSLRFLFRAICNSEAYQRASAGGGAEPYSAAAVRPLTGEQLYNSLATACTGGVRPEKWNEFRDQIRPLYGADGTWTEVTPLPGNTRQALLMRNGGFVDGLVRWEGGLAGKAQGTPGQVVETVFLGVLVRPPTEEERRKYEPYVKERGRAGVEDLIWTLVNSAEFSTRH